LLIILIERKRHLEQCNLILESFEWGGMSAFGKEMIKFFDKYKEQ
jgi:hypothetical protein